jgi:DNA-binding transcriptional MocR family regulator
MDDEGVEPDAFAAACGRWAPKALYLNPTLLNPTTHTISEPRRMALTSIARRFGVPIIEDDPYGLLPQNAPPPFAALAPELTWHIASLAKPLGAGLRVAYVLIPDNRSGWRFTTSLRPSMVMASLVTVALATRWIHDGTGDVLLAAVRRESSERQGLALSLLKGDRGCEDLRDQCTVRRARRPSPTPTGGCCGFSACRRVDRWGRHQIGRLWIGRKRPVSPPA